MFLGDDDRPETEGHGLRFTNEEWNGSIANGKPFTLEWNQTIEGNDVAQLGIFKVTYPMNGVREYELVQNLTEFMGSTSCQWTPDDLPDDLYSLWLTTGRNGNQSWTISPPWRLKDGSTGGLRWSAPIGIPIIIILILYVLSLATCLLYRRRKKLKREKEEQEAAAATAAAERNDSVSSVETAQTFDEPDFKKAEVWLISQEQRDREAMGERNSERERMGSVWTENVVFDGVRFDTGRDEIAWQERNKDEGMHVEPGTAL